jgi:hypothetical protein
MSCEDAFLEKEALGKKTLENKSEEIETAISLTTLLSFLVSAFAWGIAFFYYVKFGDAFTSLGILAGVPLAILGIGEVVNKIN